MKQLPAPLLAFLQANPNCHREDCIAVSLPTGQTLAATTGQWDVTLLPGTPGWSRPQTTFSASAFGNWSRSSVVSEASHSLNANTTTLTCIPQPSTTFPGLSVGILNAALNHLFDGAAVWIFTVYMPLGGYGNVAGVETKFQGTVTKVPTLSRNKVDFECADPLFLLNMKVPSRLFQSNCGWGFADGNCGLAKSDYTITFAAGAGSTQTNLVGAGQPDGYFAQGVVKCIAGANAGLSQTIKAHAGGVVTLVVPWLLPVAKGDVFAAIKGCDKTLTTCKTTKKTNGSAIDNSLRFGGTPFVPAPSSAL